MLQTVSVAGGQPRFNLLDRLSLRTIRCTVARERIQEVLRVFDRRVVVTGRVKTNELGDVLSVRMESIEAFADDSELPSIESVAGALDLTLGDSVSDHLNRLRASRQGETLPPSP
jgi:hypothetical protein